MGTIYIILGFCILGTSLATECPLNEVYERCGPANPPTCENPNNEFCSEQCVEGCFCKKGLVREQCTGQCVRLEECPNNQCGENEVYKCCGTACPATCKNKNETRICTRNCVQGCFCKEGYVRDECSGECVKPEDCCGCSKCKICRG